MYYCKAFCYDSLSIHPLPIHPLPTDQGRAKNSSSQREGGVTWPNFTTYVRKNVDETDLRFTLSAFVPHLSIPRSPDSIITCLIFLWHFCLIFISFFHLYVGALPFCWGQCGFQTQHLLPWLHQDKEREKRKCSAVGLGRIVNVFSMR